MDKSIVTTDQTALVLIDPQPLDQNPAAVYLASLGSETSRRSQRQALGVIANLLTGSPDIYAVRWGELRFQHTGSYQVQVGSQLPPCFNQAYVMRSTSNA